MQIVVNAKPLEVKACSLADALVELGYVSPAIATAVNGGFVPRDLRPDTPLKDGDRLEILSPMQGG